MNDFEGTSGSTGRTRWINWRKDVVAGLINAVVSVPDGLASAALAGVNPVYGLYTSIAAPIGGSLAGQRAAHADRDHQRVGARCRAGDRELPSGAAGSSLVPAGPLTGMFLGIFGLLQLGRLVRFVSHAVMIGFLSGVAVVLSSISSLPCWV